ncbi:MAG TPA: hypothetical protein VNO32_02055, partial [Candidatus Acidoferrum sp.]|nr:hypothetical protein [Candidatus Acidoferrum sp.]
MDESPITAQATGYNVPLAQDLGRRARLETLVFECWLRTQGLVFNETHIFGGWMKSLAWILVLPVLICSLGRAQT